MLDRLTFLISSVFFLFLAYIDYERLKEDYGVRYEFNSFRHIRKLVKPKEAFPIHRSILRGEIFVWFLCAVGMILHALGLIIIFK